MAFLVLLSVAFWQFNFFGIKEKVKTSIRGKNKVWYQNEETFAGTDKTYDYSEQMSHIHDDDVESWNGVLDIPENTLQSMPTDSLLLSCVDYPLFWGIYAFDSYREGFDRIKVSHNGICELVKRLDVGEAVVDFYSKINLKEMKWTDEHAAIRLTYIHLLLSDDEIISKLSPYERKQMIRICFNNLCNIVENYSDEYNSVVLVAYLGKLLYADNAEMKGIIDADPDLQNFINGYVMGIPSTHRSIVDRIADIIKREYL